MAVELRVPSAGESITEVQIGAWLKPEGAYVERDEAVVEIETDKASMELPAPVSGFLTKHVRQAGEVVPVGTVIALIEEAERPTTPLPAHVAPPPGVAKAATQGSASRTDDVRVMPAARRALAQAGLEASDVTPTGPGRRLLKEDVERHLAAAPAEPTAAAPAEPTVAAPAEPTVAAPAEPTVAAPAEPTVAAPAAASSAEAAWDRQEEVVPMTMLRRRIAQRLVEAKQTMAMLTTFNEIDMSAVLRLREQHGEAFQKRYNVKLGLMSFFVKAAIDALKRWPAVNAEIRGTDIVYKNYYDIGVAVSTDAGLVVPVIRNAERLSFAEIELAIADLATRARERRITVEELQGGTFTITNGGVFGSLLATPIINPPQSAILGLHVIQDRPVARGGEVVIRPMMYVALTYDHRIIDGRESVSFLKRIKECIEEPARMLVEV